MLAGKSFAGDPVSMSHETASRDVFLDVFKDAPTRQLDAGEFLINAGAKADQVFSIEEGTLMISRTGRDGRRQVLSFVFKDHFVGLTASDRYYFTVQAVTPARVACTSRHALNERLQSDPEAEKAFLQMVFRVVEDMLDTVYSLGQRTAVERLAVFLLHLRHWLRLGESISDDDDERLNTVALPMTREDIADFLGLKKETVIRGFAELEKRGLINRSGSQVVSITDLEALRTLAGVLDFTSPQRSMLTD